MDLGDAKITIKVDDKASAQLAKIGRNAEAMSKKFKTMGKVMVGVGIAIAGALTAAVISYAKAGDEVAKMAKRFDVSTETISELKHVAELSGATIEDVGKAFRAMTRRMENFERGGGAAKIALEELGFSADAFIGIPLDKRFEMITNALRGVDDSTRRASLAQDVFSQGAATKLIPMLQLSTQEFEAAKQEAHELGIVFDEEAAAAAEAFQDAMLRLKDSLIGVGNALANQLMPTITVFLEDKVIPGIQAIKDWVVENENLAKTLGVVAGVLMVGGALLLGLGMVARAIIAINAALIMFHSLTPGGWVRLGIGMTVATGAILGMGKLMAGALEGIEAPKLPEAKFGGIVPGPIGQPVPIMAHGGEEFAGVGKSFGGNTYSIHIGNFMGDEASRRAFSRDMKEIMAQDSRRTSFSPINRLGYFGGSSSP